jgi:hypothetical protein
MDPWTKVVRSQLGAAIDTLDNAVAACPDALWDDVATTPHRRTWYLAFHALYFLDRYLSGADEPFEPPAPFGRTEDDPAGALPERTYTKAELRSYAEHGRRKAWTTLERLTDAEARRLHRFPWGEMAYDELLLYTMRHLQHHAAQLNQVLRQRTDAGSRWVFRGREPTRV